LAPEANPEGKRANLSYAASFGLRFKALRVHRACAREYEIVDPQAAAVFVPAIRADHYFPWLFQEDFELENTILQRIAVAVVLLGDASHSIDPEKRLPLLNRGFQLLNQVVENCPSWNEISAETCSTMREASEVEDLLITDRLRLISDREAEKHVIARKGYLALAIRALAQVAHRPELGARRRRAQEQLVCAMELFQNLLNWKQDLRHPYGNRFLMLIRFAGYRLKPYPELERRIYQTDIADLAFSLIRGYCARALDDSAGNRRLSAIVEWTANRADRLQRDLISLRGVQSAEIA
jgi:hypothetical protein